MIVASGNNIANFIIPLLVWLPVSFNKHLPMAVMCQLCTEDATPRLDLTSQPRTPNQQSQGREEAFAGALGKLGTISGELEQDLGKHL